MRQKSTLRKFSLSAVVLTDRKKNQKPIKHSMLPDYFLESANHAGKIQYDIKYDSPLG